jgi:predicted transcriptional regulator of viral defense system
MDRCTALRELMKWDQEGRYIYNMRDLAKIFSQDKAKTLQEGLNRLVKTGVLERVSRGVYLFAFAQSRGSYVIEDIAKTLRRGHYNYISLESALSEYGAISQIPIDRLTVMTTGRKGEYHTPYGVIEFTHTKRNVRTIIASVVQRDRPLRLATPQAAWRDLKRVGRNTYLVDEEMINNV